MGLKFGYYVDLDERGSFRADVRNESGQTVFEVLAGDELAADETSLFEDGFMRDKSDLAGLQAHLCDLGVIPADGEILASDAFEASLENGNSPAP